MNPIISASELIGRYLNINDIVIYESTVYPGCTEEKCIPVLEKNKAYSGDVEFMTDGTTQTHIAEMDLDLNFKTGLAINPLIKGHIAFRTENLEEFKRHLKLQGINYSDWGETAVSGWKQVFFYDPDGNIVEVHQRNTD